MYSFSVDNRRGKDFVKDSMGILFSGYGRISMGSGLKGRTECI
jgi:hypothetical protein